MKLALYLSLPCSILHSSERRITHGTLLILFFFVVGAIKKIHQKLSEGFGGIKILRLLA